MKDTVVQEACSIRYAFMAQSPDGFEIIFALLTKVLALYMQITIVQIEVIRFERPIKIIPRTC